ncbi:MAG: efflux RND transporter periplasmic adaptor subunit [Mariprofundaceae bacterium]|nr:efflux RND transporter periplasmic adaptor subunit [Mariprofundaceae bacterium]
MTFTLRSLPLLTVGLLALLFSACGEQGDSSRKAPVKPVVVLKAYAFTLNDQVEALGTAQANESITITAKISGRLEKIAFNDGQQVKKGDVIAVLDQDEEQAQLMAAEVQLAEHVREVKRLQTLLARKAAAMRDLDERKTLAAVTASNVSEIKARISELTLKAPFDGKIGIRRVSPGALVQPSQVITTLDQIDPIKLDFSIPSTMLQGLQVGDRIEARADALQGQVFIGTISATDSRVDPLTRSILLRAIIDNARGQLIPGMLMRVTILANERQALMVPEECVTQKQDKHYLTLVDTDGKAEIRPVSIGARQRGLTEILDGLTAGELVVVRGMGFVKPGTKLQVTETWDRIKDSQFSTAAGQGQ